MCVCVCVCVCVLYNIRMVAYRNNTRKIGFTTSFSLRTAIIFLVNTVIFIKCHIIVVTV